MKGMRVKQVIFGILATAVILNSNRVSANATEIAVTGDSYTGSIESSFVVDSSILGGDLIVSIPAEMILTYDEATETFIDNDVVTASGNISASKKLEVATPTSITYENGDNASIIVDGTVEFGTDGVEEWSASELSASIATPVDKSISATVNKSDVSFIGQYSSVITYSISVVDK